MNAIKRAQAGLACLGPRTVLWGALLIALTSVLAFIPLFNLLGYDFCFVLGVVVAFAASDVGHRVVSSSRRNGVATSLGRLIARAHGRALGLLVLPLIIISLNGMRIRNCNWSAGLAFFALLPLGTALFAGTTGALCGLALPRRGRALALALPVLSILWAVARIYVDPPVFAYDPYGGFFPGPIYDEALSPTLGLLAYRLINLIWLAAAIACAAWLAHGRAGSIPNLSLWGDWTPKRLRGWRAGVALLLVPVAILLFALQGRMGFHLTQDNLHRHLRRRTETQHFIVHSDPADGQTPQDLALFADDLEFRYHQLRETLGVEPDGKVVVYRFANGQQKKRLVGAANTLFAKPWRREIFIQVTDFPSHKLRHEIAHVFAAHFGDPVFGVALRWWPWPRLASGLVEGVAEATDFGDPTGAATLHQDARAIIEDGHAPPLSSVVGAGFTTLAGARAYTLAASFCHFLLVEHGNEKLRALYRSAGDYHAVYQRGLADLERDWRDFLQRHPQDARTREAARERFRQPAIFHKVCARDLAQRVQEADDLRGHDPARSVALMRSVCADEPNEPNYKIAMAYSLTAAGDDVGALAILETIANDETLTLPVRRRAVGFAATIHFHADRTEQAQALVARTQDLATTDPEQRTAAVQQRALVDAGARATLGRVMFGATPLRNLDPGLIVHLIGDFVRQNPDEALGPYLLGRQLAFRDAALAVQHLEHACPGDPTRALPQPLSTPFVRECLRVKGESAYRAGDLAGARAAFEHLSTVAETEAERLRARDFLQRVTWRLSKPKG